MNKSLPHDSIVPFKDSDQTKKRQVASMFDQIAFRYDFLNRFLSGGIDVYWRKKAIRELKDVQPKNLLDVATGTADVAIMSSKILKPETIVGIDISEGMLQLGRKKIANLLLNKQIALYQGDSEAINFATGTFDAITVAFGARNFENLRQGLTEMLRVLQPGGKLVVLEFSRPKQSVVRSLYNLYMRVITPRVGKLVSKNSEAYQYLNDSVQKFPEGNDFLTIMNDVGYTATYLKPLTGGICTIYCGSKKQRQSGIVAVFLVLASLTSFGQLRDGFNMPDNDDKAYHIGIVVMGVSSRFQISHHPQFLQNDTVLSVYPENTGGIGIGGMHTFKISKHLDARVVFPQLLFANKVITYNLKYPESSNGESATTRKTVESILLGIPVQLKYKSDRINNFRVYMMAGAKYETDLSSKARSKNADDLIKLKANDFGIEAGVGFNFYMRYFILSPEIKVSNGISNVHSRDPNLKFSNVIDKIQSRQIIFSLIFEG